MKGKGGNLARDVYRDLRDRRLLSIAIVLLVAIVAVPFLIKSDADPDESAGIASLAPVDGTEALEPVVVTASSELRDYRRRLDRFQKQNPFVQQMTVSEGGARGETLEVVEGTNGGGSTVSSIDASGDGTTSSTSTDTISTSTETSSTDSETDTDPAETDADGDDTVEEDPGAVLYSTSINVRVGPAGSTKVVKEVGELEFLPDPKTPVVQHLFADFDLTAAAFVVSPAVVESEGEGRCEPTPKACQFLRLEVGDEQRFVYDDGRTYRLELLDVNLHEEFYEDGLPAAEDAPKRDGSLAAGREPADLSAE